MKLTIVQKEFDEEISIDGITVITGEKDVVEHILQSPKNRLSIKNPHEPYHGEQPTVIEDDIMEHLYALLKLLKRRRSGEPRHQILYSRFVLIRDAYSGENIQYKIRLAQKIFELAVNYRVYFLVESYDFEFMTILDELVTASNEIMRNYREVQTSLTVLECYRDGSEKKLKYSQHVSLSSILLLKDLSREVKNKFEWRQRRYFDPMRHEYGVKETFVYLDGTVGGYPIVSEEHRLIWRE